MTAVATAPRPATSPRGEVTDEKTVRERFARLKKLVMVQTWALSGRGAIPATYWDGLVVNGCPA